MTSREGLMAGVLAGSLAACAGGPRPNDTGSSEAVSEVTTADSGFSDAWDVADAWDVVDAWDATSPQDAPDAAEQRSCTVGGTPGCGLVEVAGGAFQMGDNDTTSGGYDAAPVVTVTVGPFAIDAYEVTVARFRWFWNAGHLPPSGPISYRAGTILWAGSVVEPVAAGCGATNWMVSGRDAHPIQCVDWWTAQAFCVWDGGRLPTESEWEYAARAHGGGAIRTYPWGEEAPDTSCVRAQWNNCPGDNGGNTRRVGSFAATHGMFDLAGNVGEWAADSYLSRHDDPSCDRTGATNPLCNTGAFGDRVLRGGSWGSDGERGLRAASRYFDTPTPMDRYTNLGFRCARTR